MSTVQEVAGLVFKYVGVSADSSQANLVVCRETRTRKCSKFIMGTSLNATAGLEQGWSGLE